MVDNNKEVQKASCAAVATFVDEAHEQIIPFTDALVHAFTLVFPKYQTKNLLILYDTIATLADSVGPVLAEDKYVQSLVPCIMQKWAQTSDNDRSIFPLFEVDLLTQCISAVTIAVKQKMAPYIEALWNRCINMMKNSLVEIQVS
jgi:transportin-1